MTIYLKNILDYPYMDNIIGLDAIFKAYDKGDDMTCFAIVEKAEEFKDDQYPLTLDSKGEMVERQRAELCCYGLNDTFFDVNKLSDLITIGNSECITIDHINWMDDDNLYVYNPRYNYENS